MAKQRPLTSKQEAFSRKVVELPDQSAAYRCAYNTKNMKPATINRAAKELMDNPKIATRIAELQKQAGKRADLSIDRILKEVDCFAGSNPQNMFDKDGHLLHIKDMDEKVARAIASFKVRTIRGKNNGNGDKITTITEVKLWNKPAGTEQQMKHMGGFREDNLQRGKIMIELD